jgi:hypothetical protein
MRTWIGRCSGAAASVIGEVAGRVDCGSANTGTGRATAADGAERLPGGAEAVGFAVLGGCGAAFAGESPGGGLSFAAVRKAGAAGVSAGAASMSRERNAGTALTAGGGGAGVGSPRDGAATTWAGGRDGAATIASSILGFGGGERASANRVAGSAEK